MTKEELIEWGKNVGEESRKSFMDKLESGFFTKCMSGKGLEPGYAGYLPNVHSILPDCVGIDLNFPGYDGKTLPFPDQSQDYVYSSHTLEHIPDPINAIKDWFRVIKIGGHLIISVPHQFLYEKKLTKPSRYNGDHQRFYTLGKLLTEIEEALVPNTYRVREACDNDKDFDYSIVPTVHSCGAYECQVVIQKIQKPIWDIE